MADAAWDIQMAFWPDSQTIVFFFRLNESRWGLCIFKELQQVTYEPNSTSKYLKYQKQI